MGAQGSANEHELPGAEEGDGRCHHVRASIPSPITTCNASAWPAVHVVPTGNGRSLPLCGTTFDESRRTFWLQQHLQWKWWCGPSRGGGGAVVCAAPEPGTHLIGTAADRHVLLSFASSPLQPEKSPSPPNQAGRPASSTSASSCARCFQRHSRRASTDRERGRLGGGDADSGAGPASRIKRVNARYVRSRGFH